jgi:hypothetical protein
MQRNIVKRAARSFRLRTSLAAGFLAVGALSVASIVLADPYAAGHGPGGYEPDNKTHTYCFNNGYSMSTPLQWAIDYMDNNTTVTPSFDSSCDSATDMWINDDAPSGWGLYTCQAWNAQGECGRALVQINGWGLINESQGTVHKVWCHEIGHSLGLTHNDYGGAGERPLGEDCMDPGISPSTPTTWSSHHRSHINNGIN